MGKVLYLSTDDTRRLLSFEDALRIVEEVFHWEAAGQVASPTPRIYTLRVSDYNANYRIKTAALTAIPVVGVRVTGYRATAGTSGSGDPENTRFVVLSDPSTGHPLAIVDEHWTYIVRTCSSAVLAVRYLARSDAAVAGIVGAGNMARICAQMLANLFPLKEIRVTSQRAESRERFAETLSAQLGIQANPYDSVRRVVEGADIVMTCTSARDPLVFGGWLEEGATLCGLGTEIAAEVYRSADKIVVSDVDVVREAVDIREFMRAGEFSEEDIWADLASIVTGRKPGRESPEERIVIRASGLVSQDVAICHYIYEKAIKEGMGTWLPSGMT